MVWGTYAVNIEAQMSGRSGNKVPQSARLSEGGGGGNRYLGNAQIDPASFSNS